MPWAKFTRVFNYDFRPERAVCIKIEPLDDPQEFPGKVIDAAVKAGAAERVEAPSRNRNAPTSAPSGRDNAHHLRTGKTPLALAGDAPAYSRMEK